MKKLLSCRPQAEPPQCSKAIISIVCKDKAALGQRATLPGCGALWWQAEEEGAGAVIPEIWIGRPQPGQLAPLPESADTGSTRSVYVTIIIAGSPGEADGKVVMVGWFKPSGWEDP